MTFHKPLKYRNTPVMHEGERFDSKAELRRWLELKLLEKAGQIRNLRRQVKYDLHTPNMGKVGKLTWDFWFYEGNRLVVEDTKSPATAKETAFRHRLRHFKDEYPGIEIRLNGVKV
jgi:hypothetical protein